MNIKSDSRKIEKGDTFIALDGVNHHGHEYIEDAIKRGAKRIICTEGIITLKLFMFQIHMNI